MPTSSRNLIPPGKIPWDLISRHLPTDLPPGVLLGPAAGEDAALVEMGDEVWAVASDPITFTAAHAGRLAVTVNANDVAVRGAEPRFFTAVVLIAPGEAEPEAVDAVLAEIRAACDDLGVALIGGHTEVAPGLDRTVIVGTMLGRVSDRPITTGGLREGDRIGLSGWAGLEGTAILLDTFGDRAREACGFEAVRAADAALADGWLSVLPEARIAAACPHVTALHDVTEGGVGEALHELALASGRRLEVDRAAIPILEATRCLAERLDLDPLGLIGSGAMLVGCAAAGAAELEAAFAGAGVPFTWIGAAGPEADLPAAGVPRFPRDEILKASRMEGIEAVLFDMDGTLVHSVYDWEAIRDALGVSGRSILDEIEAIPDPGEREAKRAMLEAFEREASLAATLKDGAAELVAFVRDRGFKTALVSNNSADNVEHILEKFGLAFDEVLTRDVGFHKPSGAPLREVMRRLDVRPEQCMYVGDYLFDVQAGRDAGCAQVGILYDEAGQFSEDADFTFPDVPAFFRWLRFVV